MDKSYYKGFSENPLIRLQQHNNGETPSTKPFIPWILVYIEELPSKSQALKRERNLKKYSRERLENLFNSPKNRLHKFI